MGMLHELICGVWQKAAILNDKLFRHGCDFSRWVPQDELGFSEQEGNKYQPSTDTLKRVLKHFRITEKDAAIDIGCGKGKAMYLMSRFPFSEIKGYDLSDELVKIANRNFKTLGLARCGAFTADAAVYDDYDRFNYFYLYNSVPEKVFEKLVGHIWDSIRRNPRKCVFIMMNPHYEAYLKKHTTFRPVYRKKSWISWFDYCCYQTIPAKAPRQRRDAGNGKEKAWKK